MLCGLCGVSVSKLWIGDESRVPEWEAIETP